MILTTLLYGLLTMMVSLELTLGGTSIQLVMVGGQVVASHQHQEETMLN